VFPKKERVHNELRRPVQDFESSITPPKPAMIPVLRRECRIQAEDVVPSHQIAIHSRDPVAVGILFGQEEEFDQTVEV
jgi:hypothetical protein